MCVDSRPLGYVCNEVRTHLSDHHRPRLQEGRWRYMCTERRTQKVLDSDPSQQSPFLERGIPKDGKTQSSLATGTGQTRYRYRPDREQCVSSTNA